MSLRLPWPILATCLLAACAGRPVREAEQAVYRQDVAMQMLPPSSGGMGTGAAQSYSLQPGERFRMPEPLVDTAPVLPEPVLTRELAPTRICARVAIGADGAVMFADSLTAREACTAGDDPANAALVEAALAAVRGWRFRPAVLCRFAVGAPLPAGDGCDGAREVEPVPVTLQFAFTFAVHAGRAEVHRDGMAR
ncbi:hypothetical protein [Pseudomonas sp. Hp2]|uniref:hypothetical protein n=1 Tax=Pseudomonas sp. Hp2 TaxID=701189 RepID=UPI001127D030|nr:hypothetical protein [Pseudomonas sp. Hp2]